MKKYKNMLLLLFILNIIDFFSTIHLLGCGGYGECNPFMNYLFINYGIIYTGMLKLCIGTFGIIYFYVNKNIKNAKFYVYICFYIYVFLIIWHVLLYLK